MQKYDCVLRELEFRELLKDSTVGEFLDKTGRSIQSHTTEGRNDL